MFSKVFKYARFLAVGTLTLGSSIALADSIAPISYSADLAVGDSVTIQKTVVVTAAPPTSALIDIMFVFDTTGSMGTAIDNAKASASSVLTDLNTAYGGSVQSGVGQYDDPGSSILNNLTGTIATSQASINSLFACYGSCGGDYPEVGYAGIKLAADSAAWRPGSNRFIVAFGDAPFKDGPGASDNQAGTAASLAANNIKLFGLEFGDGDFTGSITGLGGTALPGGTSPSDVSSAIEAAVAAGFSNYNTVTVGDLGGGSPEIGVSTVCTSADTGTCVGADAVGSYDRSVDRTFTFDVTFTRLVAGDTSFDTYALVDGGIVASERDSFGASSVVPEPGSLALVGLGALALGGARRRRAGR